MAERMIDGRWGKPWCSPTADAGSDVGAGRTKAFDNGDGTWRIEGVKSAEHDMSDNIIHLFWPAPRAWRAAAAPVRKGLSLFVVPKYMFDAETGEAGCLARCLRHQRQRRRV